MGKRGEILPLGTNLLVELQEGNIFDADGEKSLVIKPDSANKPQTLFYWGIVSANSTGLEKTFPVGTRVLFPPTAGFVIEGSKNDDPVKKYRLISESVIAAIFKPGKKR
jgi:hypothetical protein